jgi:cyanophycinase
VRPTRSKRGARFVLFALLLLAACAAASAKETRYLTGSAADVRPRLRGPAYHLQGGGTDVAAAFQWMIDEVRGCAGCGTKVDVVVLRSSGEDGYNEFVYKMNGVDSVETLVVKDRADSDREAVVKTVSDAEVVFFAGGDQCNYVRYFKGTGVERAVESVHARGGGIGGTSAGLAVLGEVSYDACSGGSARSAEALRDPYDKDVTFTYDFFDWPPLRGFITDTHFVERDRMGRTLAFLARQLKDKGYKRIASLAVERETSVVADRRGRAKVLGKGPVYLVLADHPPEVCEPGRPLTYTGYKLWRLPAGSTFDLTRPPARGFYTVTVRDGQILGNPY